MEEWSDVFYFFKNKGGQHGEISFLTNLSEGSLNRLESLDEGYDSQKTFDPRVVCMYDKEYVVQSTEFDIVEQGHVPILMSLPQMRNLRFQFELHPDKALLSSPVLGIWDVKLKVAPSSHLVLDLLDLSRFLWNVRFDKHKISSFLTSSMGAIRRLREALHRKRYPMSSPLRLMTSGWSMKLTWS